MNKNTKIIIGVIMLLILMFFVGKYNSDPEIITKTITLPAIAGKSDTIYLPANNTKINKQFYKYKDSVIFHNKKFNKETVDQFVKLDNDYDKVKAIIKTSEINTHSIVLEDSLIKTTSNIEVEGKLLSYQRDYILKKRKTKVEIKVPQTVFKMNTGVGLRTTINLDNIVPTANVILTNYKGNHLILEAGLDKSIQVGISLKIFDIKR